MWNRYAGVCQGNKPHRLASVSQILLNPLDMPLLSNKFQLSI